MRLFISWAPHPSPNFTVSLKITYESHYKYKSYFLFTFDEIAASNLRVDINSILIIIIIKHNFQSFLLCFYASMHRLFLAFQILLEYEETMQQYYNFFKFP